MSGGRMPNRQKDISRLMREKRDMYRETLNASQGIKARHVKKSFHDRKIGDKIETKGG